MNALARMLDEQLPETGEPGAVALMARGDDVEVAAVGDADVDGTTPMSRDSIFRIASMSKPITATAVMMLVDDGRLALEDPVAPWLPELALPKVVRMPASEIDDVVAVARPITVFDLLTSRSGHGFPADFSLPAVAPLFSELEQGPPNPGQESSPDEWMAKLARIPLLCQPGEAWLYNTSSDIQGVLIARVTGQPFADFLAERLFDPLGMIDTGFFVPPDKLDRLVTYYQRTEGGELEVGDAPDSQWSRPPAFASGSGGLVSTVDDWWAFARFLLADGTVDGRRLLSTPSLRAMTTDHLSASQREAGALFLEGQGWGFGGSVDIAPIDPWNVPGRYGWIGGAGTAGHIVPATDTVSILLTQVELSGPAAPPLMTAFWRHVSTW